MSKIKKNFVLICVLILVGYPAFAKASIILQSTTSTKNSGLYTYLLPFLKEDTGITVNVVAVGTGAAIKNAENCDGDILLVHDKEKELTFLKQGYGKNRFRLMYNDFIIIGPKQNPANLNNTDDVISAFRKISKSKSLFISRGDNSGTESKEKKLWDISKINTKLVSGKWYLETGSGMGSTINIAMGLGAYTLTDRASWITHTTTNDFQIFIEKDKRLFNQYGIISLNKNKCPQLKAEKADRVIKWLISEKGQSLIGSYRVNGQKLFFPNFKNSE
tara:strand:- start:51 stop:875 length:825 start_codon:yes stop_codon:yes gene_type:complete